MSQLRERWMAATFLGFLCVGGSRAGAVDIVALRPIGGSVESTGDGSAALTLRDDILSLILASRDATRGRGTGAADAGITELESMQVLYDSPLSGSPLPEGNAIVLTWSEAPGLTEVTATVEGFQPISVPPGGGGLLITGFPRCNPLETACTTSSFPECSVDPARINLFRFTVSGSDGSSQTVCQEVLPSWPMANELRFCGRPGNAPLGQCELDAFGGSEPDPASCLLETQAIAGRCGIIITGSNSGPRPSVLSVLVDDEVAFRIERAAPGEVEGTFCFQKWTTAPGPGEHQVTIFGVLSRSDAAQVFWVAPGTGLSFDAPIGSFAGIDPKVLFTGVEPDIILSTEAFCDGPALRRGDSNSDGNLDLSDGVFTLNFLFLGATGPGCLDAADTDDNGNIDISDGISVFSFLFQGGPPPSPPGEACGLDPTPDDALDCRSPACP